MRKKGVEIVKRGFDIDGSWVAVLDTLPVNVAILDNEGTIVATNRAWREFGEANDIVLPAGALGVNYLDVCDTDDETARRAVSDIREVLTGDRETFEMEYPCHSPDEERWFRMHVSRFGEDESYVVVAHVNVTERKRREFGVAYYEALLRDLPVVLFVLDEDGTYLLSEGKGLEAIDVDSGDAVGQSIFDRYADNPRILDGARRALAGETVRTVQTIDDTTFEVVYQPRFDTERRVEGVLVVAMNVTDRVRHEEALAALTDLSRVLMEATTPREVCSVVAEATRENRALPESIVALYDDADGVLSPSEGERRGQHYPDGLFDDDGVAWASFVANERRSLGDYVVIPLDRHGVLVTHADGEPALDMARLCAGNIEAVLDRAERESRLREQESILRRQNTAFSRLERLNEVIRRVDQGLVEARSRNEIERTVCTQLTAAGPYALAWIGELDVSDDRVRLRERAGVEHTDFDATTDEVVGGEPVETAVAMRTPQVVRDILRNPPTDRWRREALNLGVCSALVMPLCYKETLYGVFAVYADQPDAFDDLERTVLTETSQTIAYAINAVESKKALTGGTEVELAFTVRDADIAFIELAHRTGASVNFTGHVSQPDGSLRVFFTVRGASPDRVVDVLADSSEFTSIDYVGDRDEEALFVGIATDQCFVATVLDHGATLSSFSVDGVAGRAVVRLAADANVRTFITTIQVKYPDSELSGRRQRESPPRTRGAFESAFTDLLTDRQREVLETAYFSGFFDSPRASTGEEVGRSLDISQPTFNDHLRAAERKLLGLLLEGDTS